MDITVKVGEKEAGKIDYHVLPVFQYFFQEVGFDVHIDTVQQFVQLSSVLAKKKIIISTEEHSIPYSFRKYILEEKVLKAVQEFLMSNGANVQVGARKDSFENADMHLKLALLEVPNITKPLLQLTHHPKSKYHKLAEVIAQECRKREMKFKWNELDRNDLTLINIQMMYPLMSDTEFWNTHGENVAMMITYGILARFQENSPFSIFSLLPVESLLAMFNSTRHQVAPAQPPQKTERKLPQGKITLNKAKSSSIKGADVFFDYHLLLDEKGSKKIQLLGHLHIKNTGTEILQNPVICLRVTPAESIKITGQIMPANYAETKGVLNQDGAKGWQYVKENWFEDLTEKGEIWICPIQSLMIRPLQTESLSNLQITLLNTDVQQVRVEAYVFFNEQNLEVRSNNQISLSLMK